MILSRRALLVVLGLVALSACLSLPEPPPATERSAVGDPAPVFTLARTGPTPGKIAVSELWRGRGAVLVFYRGEW